ncbi:hypothetical protein BD626DRAFT_541041 [Schizophyllum amplum]|uniref:P-type ATPase A domain-containing protein n=1 Tax=Schizophyllum amplum TaxID=97359 RepID=A0A550BW53_9AGAR|nr:hypothetical protein BD626DRAFT_541041 [Auriculariopsis ampla]
MEAAVLITIALSNSEGHAPDWLDLVGIVFFVNSAIGLRGAIWSEIDSAELVLGDMVVCKIGNIVPADCNLTEAINSQSTGLPSLIGSFCLVCIGIPVVYAGFRYSYRHRLDNILMLLIGRISIATVLMVLFVTLAVGAQQLARHKVIVTHITAIEELAGVTILLTIDRSTTNTYGAFSADDVILLAAYACRTEGQDVTDMAIVAVRSCRLRSRAGIKLLDRSTTTRKTTGKLKHTTKGLTRIKLCMRNTTEDRLEIEDFAVVYERLDGDDHEAEGNRFELIGLLAIAEKTGRRLGHMFLANVLKDGPAHGGKHFTLDDMFIDADAFAGVFLKQKHEIDKRFPRPPLRHDRILTEPGLETIRGPRVIFHRMCSDSVHASAVTICIAVYSGIFAFAYELAFPPFMVLITVLLNDGIIMTLYVDRVLPSMTPDSRVLAAILAYANRGVEE